MEITIDEAILYMELYKRKLFNSVSDLDKDIEAYDIAIDIMRKYKKIEDIYYHQTGQALENSLRAVIEDGNND